MASAIKNYQHRTPTDEIAKKRFVAMFNDHHSLMPGNCYDNPMQQRIAIAPAMGSKTTCRKTTTKLSNKFGSVPAKVNFENNMEINNYMERTSI